MLSTEQKGMFFVGDVLSVIPREFTTKRGEKFTVYRTFLSVGENSAPREVQCVQKRNPGDNAVIPIYVRTFVRKNGEAGFQFNEIDPKRFK